jgi:subtilisin-like proprotein convertase family protein
MEAHGSLQRLVVVLGVTLLFCVTACADSLHTYGRDFSLRIPADPDDSRGWMDDAVIEVPDHLIVSDLDVRINLTHTCVFDLQLFVESPVSTKICLNMYHADKEFFKGEDYTNTIFDDEAELSIQEAEPPFTGRFRPREPYKLSEFDGQDAYGTWRLQIYDQWYADTGTLNRFELMITVPDPPGLSLLAPDGAEVLVAGSTYTVKWSSTGSISEVLIEYSRDAGSNWTAVDPPNTGNSGSYDWQVPVVDSSECLVRISDADNPSISDTSDAPFTIEDHAIIVPTATTDPASNVRTTTARLKGVIEDDGGEACEYRFRYRQSGGSYIYTSWTGSKTTGQSFSEDIAGLTPGSLYYFNAQARNSGGESNSASERSFATLQPFSGSGSGTQEDPYAVTDVYQLQEMNNGLDYYYKLGDDIDASDTSQWNGGTGFVPIGNSSDNFTGNLDGQGRRIVGLYINRGHDLHVGLFGYTDSVSEIKNVTLLDVDVTGMDYVGALVGTNRGKIHNCYSAGKVNGGSGHSGEIGGLVGRNYHYAAEIINCCSTANVTGSYCLGGLVGKNWHGAIVTCYSVGPVSGSGQDVGGLVGSSTDVCTDCFWDIETSGQDASACGAPKTTAQMQTAATFVDAGWDFAEIWTICEHTNYPKFVWQLPAGDFLCPDGVDLADYAFLAEHWMADSCDTPNGYCHSTDLDQSGIVSFDDLEVFVDNWLAVGE